MKFPIGLRVNGQINNVTELGIFVNLPHHHHGLIHHKDFGSQWNHEKKKFEKDQTVRVVVINNYHGKIALSLKQVNDRKLLDPTNSFNNKKDFAKSLTDLLNHSEKTIVQLRQEINNENV